MAAVKKTADHGFAHSKGGKKHESYGQKTPGGCHDSFGAGACKDAMPGRPPHKG